MEREERIRVEHLELEERIRVEQFEWEERMQKETLAMEKDTLKMEEKENDWDNGIHLLLFCSSRICTGVSRFQPF